VEAIEWVRVRVNELLAPASVRMGGGRGHNGGRVQRKEARKDHHADIGLLSTERMLGARICSQKYEGKRDSSVPHKGDREREGVNELARPS